MYLCGCGWGVLNAIAVLFDRLSFGVLIRMLVVILVSASFSFFFNFFFNFFFFLIALPWRAFMYSGPGLCSSSIAINGQLHLHNKHSGQSTCSCAEQCRLIASIVPRRPKGTTLSMMYTSGQTEAIPTQRRVFNCIRWQIPKGWIPVRR